MKILLADIKWGRLEDRNLPWWFTIVGIVGSVRHRNLETSTSPELYMCSSQMAGSLSQMAPSQMTLVVRSRNSLMPLPNAIRIEAVRLNPQAVVKNVRTMKSILSGSTISRKFNVEVFSGFGALALILAWTGIYGVVAYTITLRTREMGIRIALGASRNKVLGMVVRQSTWLAGIGVALGLLGAWFAMRLLNSLLFEVSPHSPAILVGAGFTVAAAALLASYIPARRAAKVDPMVALRCE